MIERRIALLIVVAGCGKNDKSAPAPVPTPEVAAIDAAATGHPTQCATPGTVVDGKATPPTPALFGAPGAGPPELARLHEPMPLADAKCLSPDVFAYDTAQKEVAAGVMYAVIVDRDTMTERGLAVTAPAIEVIRTAWGPDDHGCWFADDHRHRACVIAPQGSYPWGELRLDDYVPLADQLGTAPGALADVPKLVGVSVHDLEGGPRHCGVHSQPPGSPPPGQSADMLLWATEWGVNTPIRLSLADDGKLTVTHAYFEIGYRDAQQRKAILDLLSARWGGGEAATPGASNSVTIHAKDPRITVAEGTGTLEVSID